MRLFRFDPPAGRPITEYGSQGLILVRLLQSPSTVHVSAMHLAPGGQVGWHPANQAQLFLVVQGEGWVLGEAGPRQPIGPGQAAFWTAGEQHAAGTEAGLVAIVVEGEALDPGAFLPELRQAG